MIFSQYFEALNGVLKFSDIAWPVIIGECLDYPGIHAVDLLAGASETGGLQKCSTNMGMSSLRFLNGAYEA